MVARAQGAHLVLLAFLGMLGDLVRLGPGHAAMLLDAVQVRLHAVAPLHRPLSTAFQHGLHLSAGQPDRAGAAQAGGDVPIEMLGQPEFLHLDVSAPEAGVQGADPTGDVEPHTPGGDDTALARIEGRHPADGKSVAPVRVGHGIGRFDDARQAGDVAQLLRDLVVHVAQQALVAEQQAGDTHGPLRRDAPEGVGQSFQS